MSDGVGTAEQPEDPAVGRFRERARGLGAGDLAVRTMDASTRTAADAAAAVGAPVAAIVKSLVLVAGDEPVLALVSGANRIDTEHLSAQLGVPVRMADARTAKAASGFSIGGVPPFGHPDPLPTLLDADLLAIPEVWAAAGSARAVFPIASARLAELTRARVVAIRG